MYTPDCTRLHTPSLLDCTLLSTLPSMPNCTLPSSLACTLSSTLPIVLDCTLLACLTVRSQVSSRVRSIARFQVNLTVRSEVLPIALDCARLHTPGLLDCMLPSTLPVALVYTLPACLTVRSQVRSQEVILSAGYLSRLDAETR
jgi:hypothetical protein